MYVHIGHCHGRVAHSPLIPAQTPSQSAQCENLHGQVQTLGQVRIPSRSIDGDVVDLLTRVERLDRVGYAPHARDRAEPTMRLRLLLVVIGTSFEASIATEESVTTCTGDNSVGHHLRAARAEGTRWERCVDSGGFFNGTWLPSESVPNPLSATGHCPALVWTPSDARCALKPLNFANLCVARGRAGFGRILVVGDSVQSSFSRALQKMFDAGKCAGGFTHIQSYFMGDPTRWYEKHGKALPKDWMHEQTHDKWTASAMARAFLEHDLVVMNWGAHYHESGALLKAQTNELMTVLCDTQREYARNHSAGHAHLPFVIFRSTSAAHANCWEYSTSVSDASGTALMNGGTKGYSWPLFPAYNKFVWNALKTNLGAAIARLDVFPMSLRRPDLHLKGINIGNECLHWKDPGGECASTPVEFRETPEMDLWWALLLYNTLDALAHDTHVNGATQPLPGG